MNRYRSSTSQGTARLRGSISGQHTGFTDLPLTDRGERNARRLADRLKGLSFRKVFTSPLQRAMRSCELAGLAPKPKSIGTCSNGITANTKAVAQKKSMQSARTGNCFATAVLGASHRSRSEHALTES